MLTSKQQKAIRAEITNYFGECKLNKVKRYLMVNATFEYGANTSRIKLDNGVELGYTDNPNCFAKFYVNLNMVGCVETLALTKADVTKEGKKRGCENFFAL